MRSRSELAALTRIEIEDGLQQLGLTRGDAVEVHSALSSLGWVEGGAATVVDALLNVVSEEGVVMSAYPVSKPLLLTEEEKAERYPGQSPNVWRRLRWPYGYGL